jgi:ribonuclease E
VPAELAELVDAPVEVAEVAEVAESDDVAEVAEVADDVAEPDVAEPDVAEPDVLPVEPSEAPDDPDPCCEECLRRAVPWSSPVVRPVGAEVARGPRRACALRASSADNVAGLPEPLPVNPGASRAPATRAAEAAQTAAWRRRRRGRARRRPCPTAGSFGRFGIARRSRP